MRNASPLSTQVIAKTIRLHALWLADPSKGARANLAGANLAGADLTGADLTRANLTGADLRRSDLAGAYLEGANLAGTDLADANLARAYLARANLAGANLTGAYLAGADLRRSDLAGADLTGADLTGANLVDANLAYADLEGGAGEMRTMREVDQGPSLDSETGIGSAARRRVQEPLIDEHIAHTESITIHMSGIDDEWTLVVTTGKTPPFGYVAAGRILIAIDLALDSEPLAGLLWIKEYGKKMITHVWVDPEVQGQGIGRTLVDVYKKHVSRSVVLAGPFSDAGLAFAKRIGGKIVSERSRPKTTRRWREGGAVSEMRETDVREGPLDKYRSLPDDPDRGSPRSSYGPPSYHLVGDCWTVPAVVPLEDLNSLHATAIDKMRLRSVQQARREGVELPPIEIGVFKNGSGWIVDGNHRLVAARRAKDDSVEVIFTFVPEAE